MSHFLFEPCLLLATAWRPFVTPAPLWDYWWLLAFPLLASVALVYKCTKARTPGRIFGEAFQLWLTAVVAMAIGAAILFGLVQTVLG